MASGPASTGALAAVSKVMVPAIAAADIMALMSFSIVAPCFWRLVGLSRTPGDRFKEPTGEGAERLALEIIRKRRSDGMVANRVNEILAQGQKAVQYNAAYRPQQKTGSETASAK